MDQGAKSQKFQRKTTVFFVNRVFDTLQSSTSKFWNCFRTITRRRLTSSPRRSDRPILPYLFSDFHWLMLQTIYRCLRFNQPLVDGRYSDLWTHRAEIKLNCVFGFQWCATFWPQRKAGATPGLCSILRLAKAGNTWWRMPLRPATVALKHVTLQFFETAPLFVAIGVFRTSVFW